MSQMPKLLILLWLYIAITLSQQDKDYLKMIRREPIPAIKDYIICDVCKTAMLNVNRRARAMRDALKDQELEEEHYRNITRYLCMPYHDDGQWITTYDIVKKGKGLSLVHRDVYGRCGRECETIAFSCDSIREHFEEEIPEYLYSKISTAKLQNKVCKKICKKGKKKKKPKIKEFVDLLEEFEEIAEDQRSMFRSFVMGELHKREQPKDDQQDYLQRYAEAYIEQTETEKAQKAAKRRYDNKMRARKGLPPLPEEDEEENAEKNENGDGDEQGENMEDIKTDL